MAASAPGHPHQDVRSLPVGLIDQCLNLRQIARGNLGQGGGPGGGIGREVVSDRLIAQLADRPQGVFLQREKLFDIWFGDLELLFLGENRRDIFLLRLGRADQRMGRGVERMRDGRLLLRLGRQAVFRKRLIEDKAGRRLSAGGTSAVDKGRRCCRRGPAAAAERGRSGHPRAL